MRPIYNRVRRVHARPEGPNPSGPVHSCYHRGMKVEKQKFDALLSKVLRTKPAPRDKIKTHGKHGAKTPILQKP